VIKKRGLISPLHSSVIFILRGKYRNKYPIHKKSNNIKPN
jgi:hypothetical protein